MSPVADLMKDNALEIAGIDTPVLSASPEAMPHSPALQ